MLPAPKVTRCQALKPSQTLTRFAEWLCPCLPNLTSPDAPSSLLRGGRPVRGSHIPPLAKDLGFGPLRVSSSRSLGIHFLFPKLHKKQPAALDKGRVFGNECAQ